MARRIKHSPDRKSRRGLLTPQVETLLVSAVRAGSPLKDAAGAAGISVRTFETWRRRGYDEIEAREDGEIPDPDEQSYVELAEKIDLALAQSRVRAVALIQKAAAGGVIIEERTKRYRDSETGAMVEETTVRRSAPDWRASAFLLERTHRSEFGKQQEVSLSGPDGGPVQHAVDLSAAAAKIKESLALARSSQDSREQIYTNRKRPG